MGLLRPEGSPSCTAPRCCKALRLGRPAHPANNARAQGSAAAHVPLLLRLLRCPPCCPVAPNRSPQPSRSSLSAATQLVVSRRRQAHGLAAAQPVNRTPPAPPGAAGCAPTAAPTAPPRLLPVPACPQTTRYPPSHNTTWFNDALPHEEKERHGPPQPWHHDQTS